MKVTSLVIVLIWFLGVGGWIANIVKLVGAAGGDVNAMLVIRAVGVFLAPLGSVLGFL